MSKVKLPQRLSNSDGGVTVKLLAPISFGEDTISELSFCKPKAKHLKVLKMQDLSMADLLMLAGKLSGQPPSVLDELEMTDLFCVLGVIEDFLPDSARVGKTP